MTSNQRRRDVADIWASEARPLAFNNKSEENAKRSKKAATLVTFKCKLAVFELEQNADREIYKVDCLEEELLTKSLDDEAIWISKQGYAQAQDPLVKVNIDDKGEERPTFISQTLSREVSDELIALLK